MPNQPATPTRSLRVPDPTWDALRRCAEYDGETVTDTALRAFERYIRTHPSGGERR